jgi:preprotein translocase subunit SecA
LPTFIYRNPHESRKVERRHFRDRKILLYHEKERQKMQRAMSQDPYLDTAG